MVNPARSRRWRIVAAVVLVTLVLGAIAYSRARSPRPDPTITDGAFVAAANRLCAATLPGLRASKEPVRSEDDREIETAVAVERGADGIDALVVKLRALRPQLRDAAKVAAWLGHWDRYTAAGRRYAAAVRGGNPLRYGRVDDESVAPLSGISRFSRANRIDACIP